MCVFQFWTENGGGSLQYCCMEWWSGRVLSTSVDKHGCILIDISFKFMLVPQVACSSLLSFILSLWNRPYFLSKIQIIPWKYLFLLCVCVCVCDNVGSLGFIPPTQTTQFNAIWVVGWICSFCLPGLFPYSHGHGHGSHWKQQLCICGKWIKDLLGCPEVSPSPIHGSPFNPVHTMPAALGTWLLLAFHLMAWGQDLASSSEQDMGYCFSLCSHSQGTQGLKSPPLSASNQDAFCHLQRLWHSPTVFSSFLQSFDAFFFFFCFSFPIPKGSSLCISVLIHRTEVFSCRAKKVTRESGARLVLK